MKVLIKFKLFFLGISLSLVSVVLFVMMLKFRWHEKASHAFEEDRPCESLEYYYRLAIFESTDVYFELARLFASGECVQQNFEKAEAYFKKSEVEQSLSDFYFLGAYELARSGNLIRDEQLKFRVSNMIRMSKQKGEVSIRTPQRGLNDEELKIFNSLK